MSITVYADVILSELVIASGVRGRQIRKNQRITTDSGLEAINIVWTQTLREFEVGFIPMRRSAWQDIETIHEVTEGGAYGFLMLDPKDQAVTIAEGRVASLGGGQYQLYKRSIHAASGRYKDRKITRPLATGFQAYVSGGPVSSTLDADTGIVTIGGSPSAAAVTWAGRFYVPVHFQSDSIDWSMVLPSGDPDGRYLAGPSVILEEIRE